MGHCANRTEHGDCISHDDATGHIYGTILYSDNSRECCHGTIGPCDSTTVTIGHFVYITRHSNDINGMVLAK